MNEKKRRKTKKYKIKENQMFVGYAQAIVAKAMNEWMGIGSVVSYSRAQHTTDSVSSFFDAVTVRRDFEYSGFTFNISIHFLPRLCLMFSVCFSISFNKCTRDWNISTSFGRHHDIQLIGKDKERNIFDLNSYNYNFRFIIYIQKLKIYFRLKIQKA